MCGSIAWNWDRERVVNDDPARASAIFEAGLELAMEVGVLNVTTGRRVRFTPEELRDGLHRAPQALVMGEGDDARTLVARGICDRRPPLAWAGTPGTPVPERLFLPMAISYAQEPRWDLLTCGTITHVAGRAVERGSPLEIVATQLEVRLLREAARRAGRPGIGLLAGQSSASELGDLAVAHPDYLRPGDSHLVPMLNELKIEQGNIARVVSSLEYGMRNASLACVRWAASAATPPGSAVLTVRVVHFGQPRLRAPITTCCTPSTSTGWPPPRAPFYGSAAPLPRRLRCRAPCVIVGDIYPKSGAGTPEVLYETAATAIVHADQRQSPGGVRGGGWHAAHDASGLEARFMAEIGRAVAAQGLTLDQANRIVVALLATYEHLLERGAPANPGQPFDELYDLATLQPAPAWQATYERARREVHDLGLTSL